MCVAIFADAFANACVDEQDNGAIANYRIQTERPFRKETFDYKIGCCLLSSGGYPIIKSS